MRTPSCGSRRERFGGPAGGRICVVCCVTVYVTSVLITSTVDPSKRYTRSYLAGGLARSSVPAQEEPCCKKSSMGSEKRQKSFRGNLKSVVTLLFPPRFDRAAFKTRRYLPERLNFPQAPRQHERRREAASARRVLRAARSNLGGTDRIRVDFRNLREHLMKGTVEYTEGERHAPRLRPRDESHTARPVRVPRHPPGLPAPVAWPLSPLPAVLDLYRYGSFWLIKPKACTNQKVVRDTSCLTEIKASRSAFLVAKSAKSAKYRVFCGYTWKNPGIPG